MDHIEANVPDRLPPLVGGCGDPARAALLAHLSKGCSSGATALRLPTRTGLRPIISLRTQPAVGSDRDTELILAFSMQSAASGVCQQGRM